MLSNQITKIVIYYKEFFVICYSLKANIIHKNQRCYFISAFPEKQISIVRHHQTVYDFSNREKALRSMEEERKSRNRRDSMGEKLRRDYRINR